MRHFLIERGVDRQGEQQTKTKRALEYFAKGLKTAKAARAGSRLIRNAPLNPVRDVLHGGAGLRP